MKKLLLIIVAVYAGYYLYQENRPAGAMYGEPHDELIMYSLTTCGFCKQKREMLEAEGIPFTEYFIDKDRNRQNELTDKLTRAGYKPKSYGTPIFDVRGVMMPNNPNLDKVKKALYDS